MRKLLGVILGILGIAVLLLVILGYGPASTFWMVAHIIAGIVLLVSAVVMFRSRSVNDVDIGVVNLQGKDR